MTDPMDVRVRDRYVRKGVLSQADVEKHLGALPDAASNAEYIDYMKQFEDEMDAFDEEEEAEDEDEEDEEDEAPEPAQETPPSTPNPGLPPQ